MDIVSHVILIDFIRQVILGIIRCTMISIVRQLRRVGVSISTCYLDNDCKAIMESGLTDVGCPKCNRDSYETDVGFFSFSFWVLLES